MILLELFLIKSIFSTKKKKIANHFLNVVVKNIISNLSVLINIFFKFFKSIT